MAPFEKNIQSVRKGSPPGGPRRGSWERNQQVGPTKPLKIRGELCGRAKGCAVIRAGFARDSDGSCPRFEAFLPNSQIIAKIQPSQLS